MQLGQLFGDLLVREMNVSYKHTIVVAYVEWLQRFFGNGFDSDGQRQAQGTCQNLSPPKTKQNKTKNKNKNKNKTRKNRFHFMQW